jgi:hypothetical protein
MDKDVFSFIVKDSSMLISNTEYVLEKHCLLDDNFSVEFDEGNKDDGLVYRLDRVYYIDTGEMIYLTSCFFTLTDNRGEIFVEYLNNQ